MYHRKALARSTFRRDNLACLQSVYVQWGQQLIHTLTRSLKLNEYKCQFNLEYANNE